ncbi:uncharacterized protein ACBR49_019064 [Aulostomus maculatus]
MSNPLYNPYASENQRRLSGIQAERESHRVSSHLGHGSSLNSSGSPSTSPDNSEQRLPSLVPNYRSERSSASVNEDIQRSIYMHLSRAREESRQLGKQIHQPVDQGTHRIELLSSSGTGMMSHPHTAGHSENQSSHGSVSQLLNYSQPIADDNSTFYTSSSSSSYLDSGNSRFNVSKKGQHDIQSIPGLGDYDYPGPDKSHAVTEPSRPKYTSESAANILMQFGLEKEDLEHLIAYPEDQITPENLPFILRQIRMQKVKRATNAEKSKRNIPDPPPPRSTGGMDSWTSSRGAGMPQEEVPSSRHQQSKVIDYGHTGKYTGEMRDEMGSRRSEGGGSESLLLGNFDSSSHHKELLPKGGRSSALGSSRDHATLSSSYSSRLTSEVPSSNDQTILKSLSLLMKDTDVRVNTSDASKPLSLKELKADHQPTSKSQTSSALFHGGNPSRPGLVVIDSKYNTKGRTTNDGQGSTVAEQKKQSQQQQNSQKQLSQKQQELKQRAKQPEQKPQQQQQPKQEQKQTQKAPMQQQEPTQQKQFTMPAQMGRAVWPAAFSAGQPYLPVTPTFHIPSLFDVMRNPLLLPRTMPVPPAQPPSNSQPPMKGPVYKGSPSPDMMHDYAAASPRVFPHTCSLCNKECTQMKDWISHQNSTLHLENCKFLGRQYPDWDGEVALRSRSYSSTSSSDCYRSRSKSYERRRDRHSSPTVQSLSKQSNVEAVVKTLAPALLAELSKMKSSSLSSTPSSSREEGSSSAASSSSSAMKSSAKSKSGKASPPTMLTLEGVPHCLTHDEVVTAVEQFGKTKSVVLFRAQLEAIVCFEKEEDAKSLRNTKSFTLKGFPISVARERESHKEQKKPEKKTATLSTAKPQTAARKTAGGNLPGNEKTTEKASVKDPARDAKPPKQTVKTVKVEGDVTKPQVKKSGVAKDKGLPKKLETNIKESGLKKSAKGPKMVHETKMSACKGETQKPESPTGPPTVVKDKEMSEKTAKENSTSTTGGKRRDVEMSKLEDCKSKVKESGPKQLKSEAETNDMKDPDPPELGQPRAAGSEPKKVESCTEGKEQNLSAVETVPDKPKESEAAAKLRDGAEAAAVKDPSGNLPGLTAAAETEREPAAATSMEAVTPLTIGEMMEQHLHQKRIVCLKMKTCFSEKFCSLGKKQLLITNLPEYSHGCYTEQDILGFYKSVMKLMSSPVADHGSRTIFVKNILPSEARNLRETLRKIVSVRNFLPLLSKVFIELESDGDADLIGVWYALLKQPPTYEIHRLKVPQSACPPLSPPTELLQLLGQRLRVSKFGVPKGSAAPFWLTMTTTPFLFPTVSPWFVIPEYLTVTGEDTIQEASSRGAKSPTIMLTGLPETQYKHEDIAELVWSYFSKRSLQSLYYNVIVLPLQRRAFVYFEDWTSCCNFVRDHFKSPVSVGGTLLHVHFVLQSMSPESRELFSHPHTNTDVIFISLLRKLVQRCETLKSLKQRLQDSREITVKHGMVTVVSAVFPTGSEPAPQSSIPTADPAGSTNSEAVSAGQSTTEGSSVAVKNEGKQPGAEVAMDSSVGPKAKDTAEKVKVTGEEGTLMSVSTDGETSASPVSSAGSAIPAASNQILSATTILHEEKTAEVPQEWGTGSKVSQANFLFSEQNFNIDDFVTVDEVCDGPEDTSADQPTETASSSKGFNRGKTMRQSSSASSASKRTSARSLKDSRSSAAASSTSSSRLTRSSVKCSPSPHTTSVSPKKAKDSSALTKTSSSAKASSSSLSTESSSVLGVSQQSKTISPNKESNTSSQSCRTRSSSVREKETSATTVQVSHVTHSKSIKKEAKTTESAGAKSDNKVSGQGLDLISKAQEGSPLMGKDLQSLETELKDTEEPPAKDLAKEENTDDNESYQILDSFDEETDYLNQEGSYENQLTGPEKGSQDEGKALPEECSDMEVGGSFQVLDSVTEDQAAADQADSHQVEVKQLPKKDEIPVVNNTEDETAVEDTKDKENKTSNQDHIQLLDSESKSAVTDGGDGKKRKHEEEDAEAFKDGDGRCGNIPSEDNKDALKDPDSDGTEQETFEILDSIDDQPATEDDNLLAQSPGTSCDQKSKEDTIPLQEEEDQITDSVEDQPTESETDNKKRKCKNDTPSKDKPSRRPAATTRGSKIEEKSQKKQDKTVKKHETKTKDDPTAGRCKSDKIKDIFEDQYKVVDSIEDETVQAASIPERSGRRMISGGKTEDKQHTTASVKPVKGEEATFKILDSVDDEISTDEMTIKARSVRGKRARTTKTSQEDIRPTRSTPSRESQEVNREKSPKEEKAHSKESISTKKTDSAVEDDKAKDEASGRRRRGRPKKEIETAKKDSAPLPKGDKDLDEEEAGYQILDSVENKIKDEPPATGGRGRRGRPKKEVRTTKKDKASLERSDQNSSVKEADEEEAIYQILDSVEEEMVDNYSPTEQHESAGTEDITKKSAKKKGKGEEPMYQIVDSLEVDQVQEEPPAAEVSDKEDSREGNELRKGTRKDGKKENNLSRTPQRSTKVRKTKERKNTSEAPSNLVTLDEVSEEEEDFSDDTVEEEKVRKRQAAVKEKRFAKEEEERKHQEREERRSGEQEEREHRSSSEGTRRTMEEEQKEDVRAPESRERARDITEEELQALVTLDEIVEEEEEEEEGKPCLLSQEDESAGSINPEMLVTLDEAGDEEEKVAKDQPVEISRPAKRRHDDTEENMNFVTVDEVVEEEEEDEQEEKEAPTPNTRGRGRKRSRRTPVRKSTRGKKGSEKEETQAAGSDVPPPTSVVAPSSLDLEIKKTASAGQELTPEQLDNQNQGGGKRRSEPVGPEAKRSRSQSPCVAATFELPAFRPDNPLGQAFVVPKSGFFCNLCSVFYLNESTAKEVHCSSQRHYDNLKKYYQKLQQQQGGPSTQGSLSD